MARGFTVFTMQRRDAAAFDAIATGRKISGRDPSGSAANGPGSTDWPTTNFDQTANRYSPLDQITAAQRAHAAAGLELSSQAGRL